jgi:hypothetical protein
MGKTAIIMLKILGATLKKFSHRCDSGTRDLFTPVVKELFAAPSVHYDTL